MEKKEHIMNTHRTGLCFTWFIGLIFFIGVGLNLPAAPKNPVVIIQTEVGEITLEIFLDKAPISAANFLRYVRENRYAGATFYRVVKADNQPNSPVKIAVIQGGIPEMIPDPSLPPIPHETTAQTGVRHLNGTISMARGTPGTASNAFFICVGDQPELDFGGKRNPDGLGFAAFGQVIAGMETVLRIHQAPTTQQALTPMIKITGIKERQ